MLIRFSRSLNNLAKGREALAWHDSGEAKATPPKE